MSSKTKSDVDHDINAICENALATRLMLLTLVSKARRRESRLH